MSADLVMTLTEGCALSDRPLTLQEMSGYAGVASRTAEEAVRACLWLDLVSNQGGGYAADASVRSEFPAPKAKKVLLFRQRLQRKKAFYHFATFLDCGDDAEAAAEKVRVLYRTSVNGPMLLALFSGWGRTAGVFFDEAGILKLKPELHASDLPFDYLEGLKKALEDDMKARIFIAKKVSDRGLQQLPDAGVERAVKALRGITDDPRNSVEDVGELFEDYLRTKAAREQVPVDGARGIGSVAEELRVQGKIADEHKILADGVNALRVMAAHPTRAQSGFRWEIMRDSGLEAVLFTLSVIRSMQEFESNNRTVF